MSSINQQAHLDEEPSVDDLDPLKEFNTDISPLDKKSKDNEEPLPAIENAITDENIDAPANEEIALGASNDNGPESNALFINKRSDRYGNEIISRKARIKMGKPTSHKITYIDQVHLQNNNTKADDETPEAKKKQLKLITLESDKNRGIVNLFYVESYKKYNAMEIDEISNSNAICKCSIF